MHKESAKDNLFSKNEYLQKELVLYFLWILKFQIPKMLGIMFDHYFASMRRELALTHYCVPDVPDSTLSSLHVGLVKSLLSQASLSLFFK